MRPYAVCVYGCTVADFAWFVNCFRFRPQKEVLPTIEFWKFTSVIVETRIDTDAIWLLILILSRWSRNRKKYLLLYSIATRSGSIFNRISSVKKRGEFRLVRLETKRVFSSRFILAKISALSWLSCLIKRKSNYDIRYSSSWWTITISNARKNFWTELLLFNKWISGQFLKSNFSLRGTIVLQ